MGRHFLAAALLVLHAQASPAQVQKRDVELRAADGTLLKATYFSAGRPGPGVVLLHMCNNQRTVWDTLGAMLAARGVHAIAVDYRGFGESGGERENALPLAERRRISLQLWPGDIDTVFAYFAAQPGVDRMRIGAAGGSCGGWNAVHLARRHPEVKTLVLLAGGEPPAREFLPHVPWMPVLAVAAHDDPDAPDAVAAMRRLLTYSTSTKNRFKEYTHGGHGTDLFRVHAELEPLIADWFVEHLITRPVGADPSSSPRGEPEQHPVS